jgi:phospholipid/cholesterol/gamma-HCH transport system ATP-binding protein
VIRLEGLKKQFGDREILRGMDLHIERGQTVCLIGGSGTGKSVTLKHIMRLLEPDSGKVIFDGQDISHVSGRKLQNARQKMGVLFQSGALLNWLTVGQNVALPLAENTSMARKEIDKRVMETLELLQIPQAKNLFPNQISGGMQKRAGLARAVIWKPPCILYDEPTSGLDPVITALVDEMIVDMREKLGVTQVIVTHDMTSAYRTADKIAMLFKGQVVQYGTPDDIKNTDNPIVRQFIEGLVTGPITEGMKRVTLEDKGGD